MGSALVPNFPNTFLKYYEKELLYNCPANFELMIYKRYVHDIFVLFSSKEHLYLFINYINKQDKCLKFSSEVENNNYLSFLEIKLTHNKQEFETSVYRKPIFSGPFTYYESCFDLSFKQH